mgnify:FL=1
MRTLEFTADRQTHPHAQHDDCHVTQQYVTALLSEKLKNYGFETQALPKTETVNVSVADHPIALGVTCRNQNASGVLVCEINAAADESQDWFSKIETQSLIKQLANAVENSLKDDHSLQVLQWKK